MLRCLMCLAFPIEGFDAGKLSTLDMCLCMCKNSFHFFWFQGLRIVCKETTAHYTRFLCWIKEGQCVSRERLYRIQFGMVSHAFLVRKPVVVLGLVIWLNIFLRSVGISPHGSVIISCYFITCWNITMYKISASDCTCVINLNDASSLCFH